MLNKKMLPCRVCGKFFEPCATCQTHNNMFRWRNFACSKECAKKYISDTIAYRNSLKENKNNNSDVIEDVSFTLKNTEETHTTKRKYNKKKSTHNVETIKEEREQID